MNVYQPVNASLLANFTEKPMPVMQQVPANHPLMKAWEKYRASDDFRTAFKNAADLEYLFAED